MVTEWPTVTVIIGGDGSTAEARHTAASLRHSVYPGELQILSGAEDELGSPTEIANDHVGEAKGAYIWMVPPGTTLDPHCLHRLVMRAEADPATVAVALQWRASDGSVLEAGSHLLASDEIGPLFHGGSLPEWLTGGPYRTRVSSQPSLLIRAQDFFVAGGFNLELDGSPYQAAYLALALTAGGSRIEVETRAIAFAPPAQPVSESELVRGRNVLQRDFSDGLNQLHYQSSIDADLSVLLGDQRGTRTLWAASHLPDPNRSGADARHLEMIQALVAGEDEVVVWATHTDGSDSRALDNLGIRWVAQPHVRRWDLRQSDKKFPWLRELVRQLHWDHLVIADPNLVARVAPLIREHSPDTAIIADLGSVRHSAAHAPASGTAAGFDLPGLSEVDAVVAATGPDQAALAGDHPASFGFSALGHGQPVPANRDGGLLFVGNLLHRPNAEAIDWWTDSIAGRVEARMGRRVPLRVVGNGSELYRHNWNHPAKVEIGGWCPDLSFELSDSRVFLVPLLYATGTGGRIATALAHGVPTVVSVPAAAMLPAELRDLVKVGETADELADHVATLMSDDGAWGEACRRLAAWDAPLFRQQQQDAFARWAATLETSVPASA
ncbi:MAG: glycosyltransferase family 4 protein [Acidimicrobiia bacterium]|nr:glycosyltransferase family 4 protein [Acidimicrobiia bacterium]